MSGGYQTPNSDWRIGGSQAAAGGSSRFKWSTYQRAIFDDVENGAGHTVVNAVAGAGKTSTLVEAIKHVPHGLRKLFMAFNTLNVKDAKARLKGVDVEVLTFHSYGLKAVTQSFTRRPLVTESGEKRVAAFCRDKYGKSDATFDMRCALVKAVERAKNTLAQTEDEIATVLDVCEVDATRYDRAVFIADVIELLERCKSTRDGRIDFEDMVWLPVVKKMWVPKFDRVFVDETQDLNAAQIALVLRAVKSDGRILAVGDPNQAIYQFRGADEHAFENVKTRLSAKELPLSVSYRCCASVVKEAQKIVSRITAAPGAEEGAVQRSSYEDMRRHAAPGDYIISRTNAPLTTLCMSFLAEGRHANIFGRDVSRDLTALVKKSRAKTVADLRDFVRAWSEDECAHLVARQLDPQRIDDRAKCVLAISDGAASISDVLEEIERLFTEKDDTDRIMLGTTHRAKGKESDRVWLLGDTYAAYRYEHSDQNIGWQTYQAPPSVEDRNLYYVAVTRAKDTLIIVGPT